MIFFENWQQAFLSALVVVVFVSFVKKDSDLDGMGFLESPLAKMKKARVLEVLRDGRRRFRIVNIRRVLIQ